MPDRQPMSGICRGVWIASAALAVMALSGHPAVAQTGQYQRPLSGYGPEPSDDLFSLQDVGRDLGAHLAAQGVYLRGGYIANGIENADGGRKTGAIYTSMVLFGADFDMQKIFNIPGGSLHITMADRNGPEEGKFTGSPFNEPTTYGPLGQDAFRLSDFYWRQSLFNDHLRFEVGRTQWTPEFATSDLYPLFIGWDAINVAGPELNTGAWQFDAGYWGGRVTLKPTRDTYLRAAAYEVNPTSALASHQGFPGRDWTGKGATGYMNIVEGGVNEQLSDHRYAHSFDVGFQYDSSPYPDYLYNTGGQVRALSGGVAMTHLERSTIYWQAQQVVWRPNPLSNKNLQLFASGAYAVEGYPVIDNSWQIGLLQRGTFPHRPNDTFGLLVDYWRLNPRISENFNVELANAGATGRLQRGETILEVNYGYELAPAIFLRPFIQYIAHPDQTNLGVPDPRDTHATVVGLQLNIQFAPALGLPTFPSKP